MATNKQLIFISKIIVWILDFFFTEEIQHIADCRWAISVCCRRLTTCWYADTKAESFNLIIIKVNQRLHRGHYGCWMLCGREPTVAVFQLENLKSIFTSDVWIQMLILWLTLDLSKVRLAKREQGSIVHRHSSKQKPLKRKSESLVDSYK